MRWHRKGETGGLPLARGENETQKFSAEEDKSKTVPACFLLREQKGKSVFCKKGKREIQSIPRRRGREAQGLAAHFDRFGKERPAVNREEVQKKLRALLQGKQNEGPKLGTPHTASRND